MSAACSHTVATVAVGLAAVTELARGHVPESVHRDIEDRVVDAVALLIALEHRLTDPLVAPDVQDELVARRARLVGEVAP